MMEIFTKMDYRSITQNLENELVRCKKENVGLQRVIGLREWQIEFIKSSPLKDEKQKYDQNKEISRLKKQNVELESANEDISKILKENNEELSRLRNHSQSLLTQIKRLKLDKKSIQEELNRKRSSVDKAIMTDPIERLPEQANKDIYEKLLEKEEVFHLKNHNQKLMEEIKQLKDDKSQEETFKKLQNDNNLLENELGQIQQEASRLS